MQLSLLLEKYRYYLYLLGLLIVLVLYNGFFAEGEPLNNTTENKTRLTTASRQPSGSASIKPTDSEIPSASAKSPNLEKPTSRKRLSSEAPVLNSANPSDLSSYQQLPLRDPFQPFQPENIPPSAAPPPKLKGLLHYKDKLVALIEYQGKTHAYTKGDHLGPYTIIAVNPHQLQLQQGTQVLHLQL